jgi:hypothetical protein
MVLPPSAFDVHQPGPLPDVAVDEKADPALLQSA